MRSNCLVFALVLWKRRGWRGYVTFRVSRYGPFLHFLYGEKRKSGDVRLVSFVPTHPKRKPVPPVLFKGRSKWGDL